MNVASPSGHPPSHHGSGGTSAWFAVQYVHNHIPNISSHDLIRLVSSIGAETHGKYTYQSIVNATSGYLHDGSFPQGQATGNWSKYIPQVILAAKHHGHKSWISGFAFTPSDVPGTGGPNNIQKAAIATSNGLSDVGNAIGSATGGLFSGPILILVVIVIIVLVVKK